MAKAVAEWRIENGKLRAYLDGVPVTWFPQPGSQDAFLRCPIFEALLTGNRGGGKSLSNMSRILTNSGWKNVGDVTYTDNLVAPDGTYTSILNIFPHGPKPLYTVTFCDGASIVADGEHRWLVRSQTDGYKNGVVIKTTDQIRNGKTTWSVPVIDKPVPGKQWVGPDPYILGFILGDGTLTGNTTTIYTADYEVQEYLLADGWTGKQYKPGVWQMHTGQEKYRNILGRVSKEAKYVPEELLMADPHTRLNLLQGMMDADGCCDKEGRIEACTISEKLADAYVYLARSLGGLAQKHWSAPRPLQNKGLEGVISEWSKPLWRIKITHRNVLKPFTLKRKVDRILTTRKYQYRAIKSIEPAGTGAATCFAVAHPSKLFVVDGFIVTHNTDTLLMDFARDVGVGYGHEWNGILFRRTYPELEDIIEKSIHWFHEIWPESGPNPATFNIQSKTWTWKTGEILRFRHMSKESDYWSYHGHSFSFLGWEEITTWADPGCYTRMMSCCRSSHPAVAKIVRVRATTNPYGPGHNWCKKRFRLPIIGNDRIIGPVIRDSKNKAGDIEPPRVAIRSSLAENKILLIADPGYIRRIRMAARNEAELAAWVHGSWDITCGGMFDDLWDVNIHKIQDIPFELIKRSRWKLNRAYDHGQSKPFAVGWFAESNGRPIEFNGKVYGPVKGDVIMFQEWYGWNGEDNEGLNMPTSQIAKGIKERETQMGLLGRIKRGPADRNIWTKIDGQTSPNSKMRAEGIYWDKADMGQGSRSAGWERIREMLLGALGADGTGERIEPGIFVCDRCQEWLRTVPSLPRNDNKLDDVNTEVEDHCGDMTRYRVRWSKKSASQRSW